MFHELQEILRRPAPFEQYTAADLWTDEHTSAQMLACHLDATVDLSSRNAAFIDRSVAWITERFDLGPGKRVADFGCGPGLYTTRLAASGAEVVGIDFSERSIRYARDLARQRTVEVEHVLADYRAYETDRHFDLITLITCDYCALSPAQRSALLRKFRSLLRPGGAVLFDAYSLRAYDEREEATTFAPNLLDGFWSAAPYVGFLRTFKYDAEKVVLDKYTIVEEARTRVVYNWLQYFDEAAITAEVRAAGLEVEGLLGDVAGSVYDAKASEFAVVAG